MKGRTPQQAVEDWILTGSHNQLPDVNETLILYKNHCMILVYPRINKMDGSYN